MLFGTGDIFQADCSAICIPTNGALNKVGALVMGAGVAKQAVDHWPGLPDMLGDIVYRLGHGVHQITKNPPGEPENAYLGTQEVPYHIISFPTKPTRVPCTELDRILPRFHDEAKKLQAEPTRSIKWLPGWKAKSDINLIKHSCEELVELTNTMKWKKVCLPKVGCGAGELSWSEVATLLKQHLDNRFVIVTP